MKIPMTSAAHNLRWTSEGTVWADFLITGIPYGLRPVRDKLGVRALHTALIRALPGESLWLGVTATLDPAEVVAAMLDGVDLDQAPEWAVECDATLDSLDVLGVGRRIYWLSVPLRPGRPTDALTVPAQAAMNTVQQLLGLPTRPPGEADITRRLTQVQRLLESIPSPFKAVPATVAQMVWLHQHQLRRGMYTDDDMPFASASAGVVTASGFTAPLLDEGAQSDLTGLAQVRRFNPFDRRYLKVQPADAPDVPASYQSLLVLAATPPGGTLFPGEEILGRIDRSGLDVDWAIRMTVRTSDAVIAANQRALRQIADQIDQRDHEITTAVDSLTQTARDLTEYARLLDQDKLEVEAQATVILCVASPDATHTKAQALALRRWYEDSNYKVAIPVGGQEDLWWQMMPGVRTSMLARQYAQLSTSCNVASMVPFVDVSLGDRKGSLVALNISNGPFLADDVPCGPTEGILHDIDGATDRDVSGSIAIAGELGSGKSVLMKKLCGDVVDRNGRVIAIDRTDMGEWEVWARSVAHVEVVDILQPRWSLDPLRMFGPDVGSRMAQSFLTPLLDVPPTSDLGVVLADVLDPQNLTRHGLLGLGDVLAHLQTDGDGEDALRLAAKIRVFARRDLGRVVFDPSLPTLPLDVQAVVIRTHTLQLPNPVELENEHLFRAMSIEKMFGRAAYALIAGIARAVCFADRDQLAVLAVDEFHGLAISPEATQEAALFIRDGRKHRAALIAGSHDPLADFGSDTLRGLIPTRFQMRQRDQTLARKGLQWLGFTSDNEEMLSLITSGLSPVSADGVLQHRRGEAVMQDSSGNVGIARILLPVRADRARAVLTGGSRPDGGPPIPGPAPADSPPADSRPADPEPGGDRARSGSPGPHLDGSGKGREEFDG